MRYHLESRRVRALCYGLIVALVSTFAPTPLVAPARAQLMPQYAVGVVDFVNESGVQGELLARLATDAVVVEMAKSNRYEVSITRSVIKSEMEKTYGEQWEQIENLCPLAASSVTRKQMINVFGDILDPGVTLHPQHLLPGRIHGEDPSLVFFLEEVFEEGFPGASFFLGRTDDRYGFRVEHSLEVASEHCIIPLLKPVYSIWI